MNLARLRRFFNDALDGGEWSEDDYRLIHDCFDAAIEAELREQKLEQEDIEDETIQR